jgi:hypothetical protein
MRKTDWFIIGGVLLLALIAFAASRLLQPEDSVAMVTIYVGGEVYARVPADDYQTITIDQGNGMMNVVVIDESGVRMESSTCKNQICVKQGTIDTHHHSDDIMLNNWIICMPNGVSIEVTGLEGDGR